MININKNDCSGGKLKDVVGKAVELHVKRGQYRDELSRASGLDEKGARVLSLTYGMMLTKLICSR